MALTTVGLGQYMPRELGRRLAPACALALITAIAVGALGYAVRTQLGPMIRLDKAAIRAATAFTRSHPVFRDVLVVWQEVFQPWHLYVPASLLCVHFWRRHRLTSRAAWAFVTMMVGWNLALLIKGVVHRARPLLDDAVAHAPGYSFPSGHVANLTIVTTVVLLLVRPMVSRGQFLTGMVASAALVVLTALDRVFLGVHFPSDTVAGAAFGLGAVLASYRGYLGWNPSPARPDENGTT